MSKYMIIKYRHTHPFAFLEKHFMDSQDIKGIQCKQKKKLQQILTTHHNKHDIISRNQRIK